MYYSSEFKKEIYGMTEVSKILKCSTKQVQKLCNKGKLGCIKSEYGWRKIPRKDLLQYLFSEGKLVRDKEQTQEIFNLLGKNESLNYVLKSFTYDNSYLSFISILEKAMKYDKLVQLSESNEAVADI